MDRRSVLKGGVYGVLALGASPWVSSAKPVAGKQDKFADLERRFGGRLGVAIHDLETGQKAGHRQDERFLMCSTFKLLEAAAILARVDKGAESLDRRIVFGPDVLLSHAPITRQHAGGEGMTVGELCQAAITVSDNTAANLLLESLGGLMAFNGFLRSLGDHVTRLDRNEPTLNVAHGDLDTTSPKAMLGSVEKVMLGDALSPASREQLAAWMKQTTTGLTAIRAGLPPAWLAGDKTGRGSHGETNDITLAWPPGRKPVLIVAYYAHPDVSDDVRSHVLAEIGRMVVDG
ncbi:MULTISPECIES: class A beta-lactamase [Dyella]|uniref:Beta-lactamase n=2 Tax=Dyella TaxID=231454 RepID=A0A4R0Z0S3_9GAMM|nr:MULTISPECIES: class A beta-lactamase [Dyella]TBR39049.1 class A beta-lactamase [Dyella terrae]TCI13359.1 class A beta-lactamase [Dyella soli]